MAQLREILPEEPSDGAAGAHFVCMAARGASAQCGPATGDESKGDPHDGGIEAVNAERRDEPGEIPDEQEPQRFRKCVTAIRCRAERDRSHRNAGERCELQAQKPEKRGAHDRSRSAPATTCISFEAST